MSLFEQVVKLEKDAGNPNEVRWQWKALEQIVLLRAKLGQDPSLIVSSFSELLSHMNKVTPTEVSTVLYTEGSLTSSAS